VLNRRLASAFIIALVVAGVFTYWLSQRFQKSHAAVAAAPRNQYVAAVANLDAGQTIKPENLKLVDWPAAMPLAGAFTTPQPLIGRVVLYPLTAGEPIRDSQLAAPGATSGLTVKIPDGMRAISLHTDDVVGVAGFLLPGTHVDVLVTIHPPGEPDPVTNTVLQNVQVLTSGQKSEPDPEGKPITATVVTLLVTPEQAEKVDLATTQGIIHFTLRNGVDNEEFKGPPAQFAELAGMKTPDGKPILKPAAERPAPKPYVVETFMGGTVKTDNFQ